jgi:epoxyqueuosine reductase
MRVVREPTYKKYITGRIERFDDRQTGFSRGRTDPAGSKYDKMHEKSVENIRKKIRGKTILDHGLWVSGRTVEYVMRRTQYGREGAVQFNREYKMGDVTLEGSTRIIKRVARWLGADLVGVAPLNRSWVYSHWGHQNAHYCGAGQAGDPIEIPEDYQYVIVLVQEMDYEIIKRTPGVEPETDLVYSKMGFTACSLATFITEMGYKAIPSVNELGIDVAFAADAGLGEMGRMGLLMTREFGPRCRIGKVFTNLPLEVDPPIDIGVQAFCEKCERCSRHCPSGAIKSGERTGEPWDPSNNRGMLKWPVHAMKCLDWWVKNGSHCSICVRVCPWNKRATWFHRGVRALAERDILTKFLVFMDERMGYGRQVIDFFD